VPAPLPAEIRRVSIPAGQPLESIGLYFMDLATGKLDAWLPPTGEYTMPSIILTSSDDERWILATTQTQTEGHLIRRSDGAAFRYDPRQVQLTMGPGVMLARPAQWESGGMGRNCALLDGNTKVLSTFAVGGGCTQNQQVLFSPDGKRLAVAHGDGGLSVSLVSAATGAIRELGPFTAPAGQQLLSTRMTAVPGTGDLLVHLALADAKDYGKQASILRRYSWDGELRAEKQFSGTFGGISPDGSLIAIHESLSGRLGQALAIHDWSADRPRFRVAGGHGAQWLADSRAVLTGTFRGYRLVSAAGEMVIGPGTWGDTFRPFDSLIPSPDDANLFLAAGVVIDRQGQTRQQALITDAKNLRITQASWGPTARSIHFTVQPNFGKGYDADFSFYIGPNVQRPPYPEQFPLQVEDAKGECLNLRAEAAEGAKVVRCLPTGTRLSVPVQENGEPFVNYGGQRVWLQVGTEKGEMGWVAIDTKSVSYAK
jgi:hypothetical protein